MSDITRRDFLAAIGALIGTAGAVQFERQLGIMTRALSGPQEWIFSFDGPGLERLLKRNLRMDSAVSVDGHGHFALAGEIALSESDLWALATLTDPDGAEWRTVDGETWTQGERKMIL